jgi:hypothetical protein
MIQVETSWEPIATGLIVESFTVPPQLAEKGLTGQVAAGRPRFPT